MRIPAVFLPTIGILLGLALIGAVYEGLEVEGYLEAAFPQTSPTTAGPAAGLVSAPFDESEQPVTSLSAAYVRWAALFGALLAAWTVLVIVASETIWRLRDRITRGSAAAQLLWIALPVIAIVGATLDVSGLLVNRTGGAAAQTPSFSGVRNFLGWIAGCLAVVAQSYVLGAPHDQGPDRRARARKLASDVRSMKMLLFATASSLAIGVGQVSALARLALITPLATSKAGPVELTPYMQDLEQSFTLGAGTLFTIIAVMAYLPAMSLLEAARVRLLRELTKEAKSKGDPDADAVETLQKSVWSYAADSGALLLPLLSGIAVTRL